MKVTILGCGSSTGVPRIGNHWGACDPAEPRNRRRRCSILVEEGASRVLVDTSPDLREQLLGADVGELDAVVYTHEHADQTAGIDDLRAIALNMRQRVQIHADAHTLEVLRRRYDYIFEPLPGTGYPAVADAHVFDGPFTAGGIAFTPFRQLHGRIESLGFRIGRFGYANDVNELPEEAFATLDGVEILIVDALRYTEHPSHANVDTALRWIARIRPRRAVLTNLHIDLDYRTLAAELPEGVEPAYDGMVLEA